MKLIVCGGAGYIGSHMCKLLAEHGHDVAVVDNLSTGHLEAVRWGRLFQGDIGDRSFVAGVLASFEPDAVLHFAAKSIVPESAREPALYYLNNVAATLNLLEEVRKIPGCTFIFSSTAAIFGTPQSESIDEGHPTLPINTYGRSKLQIEEILKDYSSAYGLSSVSFRYFNAAGADPTDEIGEAHTCETHLIPRLLEHVLKPVEPVGIYGDDYPTPDGTCIRDFVHVNDLCRAHMAGLDYLKSNAGAYAFNLGTGKGFSVREIVKTVEKVTGCPLEPEIHPRRAGDPSHLVAAPFLAQSALDWRCEYTEIEQVIETAWRWHRQRRY